MGVPLGLGDPPRCRGIRPPQPPVVANSTGVMAASHAVNRASASVRRCPRLVLQRGSPQLVWSRVTVRRHREPASGRKGARSMGRVDQLHQRVGSARGGRHVLSSRAQLLGEGLDRGHHEFTLKAGQLTRDDHRVRGDREGQPTRGIGVSLIRLRVIPSGVEEPVGRTDEPGDRRRRPPSPAGSEFGDHCRSSSGSNRSDMPGHRVDMLTRDDPGGPRPRPGSGWLRSERSSASEPPSRGGRPGPRCQHRSWSRERQGSRGLRRVHPAGQLVLRNRERPRKDLHVGGWALPRRQPHLGHVRLG